MPVRPAEDPLAACHRMYRWDSIHACHLCDAGSQPFASALELRTTPNHNGGTPFITDDYQKVVGYCSNEGTRVTMWLLLPHRSDSQIRCYEPDSKPFPDVVEPCGTVTVARSIRSPFRNASSWASSLCGQSRN